MDSLPESWDKILLGEYEGGLEIFCEDDSFYMEKIRLIVIKVDNYYSLKLDSKTKFNLECISLNILAIEDNVDENDKVYVDIIENKFYQTKEVGAYKNTIFINDMLYNQTEGPNVEIRLSLICLSQDNIRHIFIRAKKFL